MCVCVCVCLCVCASETFLKTKSRHIFFLFKFFCGIFFLKTKPRLVCVIYRLNTYNFDVYIYSHCEHVTVTYICMYITYIHIYTYIYRETSMYIHVYTNIQIHVYTCVYSHMSVHTYVYIHMCIYTYIHVYMYKHRYGVAHGRHF